MTPTPLPTLAVAQTIPVRGDVSTNGEQHTRLAANAARRGAELIVFPELSLTGYELDLADELAFSEGDARLSPLAEAASRLGVTMVVGAPVRMETGLHIGAFVLTPDGAAGLYTKHHLGDGEGEVFQAGDRNPLVEVGGTTAAVAICADANQASHAAAAAARGAGMYLVSAFVVPDEIDGKAARLEAYAEGHSMAVVFANFGGPSGGLPSAGGSTVWSDTGRVVARLEGPGAGLVVARTG